MDQLDIASLVISDTDSVLSDYVGPPAAAIAVLRANCLDGVAFDRYDPFKRIGGIVVWPVCLERIAHYRECPGAIVASAIIPSPLHYLKDSTEGGAC
ncbi:hypothetical protein AAII07_37280 [Microvirga sp. 0TCS3.31]